MKLPGGGVLRRSLAAEALAVICILLVMTAAHSARGVVLYQTGFEITEGYDTNADLVGQQGWIGVGSGGNGMVSGWFAGRGEQAYIGYSRPLSNDAALYVYQPLDKKLPQAQFNVTLAIEDSSNTNYDDFYWSVYNQEGHEFFSVDFNNFDLQVYYRLDGTNDWVWSGLKFTNGTPYRLGMLLDFFSNRWSATLSGQLVATNQAITTLSGPMDLGDIDAVWYVYDPKAPGDNFMVFDDYQVTANIPRPRLSVVGTTNGPPTLRLMSSVDGRFAFDGSSNLVDWVALKTNSTSGGLLEMTDDAAGGAASRFYRARWVP